MAILLEHLRHKLRYGLSLSARLKLLIGLWIVSTLASIVLTLALSWRMEGAGAAINDAGSLRMRTYRMAWLADERHAAPSGKPTLAEQIGQFDHIVQTLIQGDITRPLFLPNTAELHTRIRQIDHDWQQHIRPMLETAQQNGQGVSVAEINDFVDSINVLVRAAEDANGRNLQWLRLFQSILLAMVLMGSLMLMLVLYTWVVYPINRLREGVNEIRSGHFGKQVEIGRVAEFAQLAIGFNQMSSHLQLLYHNLEGQVAEKTEVLARKNRELEMLYQTTRDLHLAAGIVDAAQVFLNRVLPETCASAGSVRLYDADNGTLGHAAVVGIPEPLWHQEPLPPFVPSAERREAWDLDGLFDGAAFFPIWHHDKLLGALTLYFQAAPMPDEAESHMLEALCRQLGLAVAGIRLVEESKQLAVMQERNLLAQGLHDSIAQTLSFLNLQAQMLESAIQSNHRDDIDESLTLIKAGVQECYEDVRELLHNFRTKLTRQEFPDAVASLAECFRQQTRVDIAVEWHGNGVPLSAAEQLQVIFIIQESLSNIRKHAEASHAVIRICNERDFTLEIADNGVGFAIDSVQEYNGRHVGINIMRERAQRIQAQLAIRSEPGKGTTVSLMLPEANRSTP